MSKNKGDETLCLFPIKPVRQKPAPGRVVRLFTNLFKLSLVQNKPIYFMTAHVDKESQDKNPLKNKISSHRRRLILDEAIKIWFNNETHNESLNYLLDRNGTAIYALFDFFRDNTDSREFRVSSEIFDDEQDGQKVEYYKVNVFKKGKLDLQNLFDFCKGVGRNDITFFQEHIRALNVIMRGRLHTIPENIITTLGVIPFKKENQFELSKGVIGNRGYFMSVRPAECGVVLNVANLHSCFHEANDLVDLLKARFSVRDLNRPLSEDVIKRLKKHILNKQVEACHINYGTKEKPHFRKYRIGDISESALKKFTLVDKATKDTQQITISDYFLKEYKWKIKYPHLPCIVDKGRYLPLEVCRLIEKQRLTQMLSPEETAALIKQAAIKPDRNFGYIRESVNEIKRLDAPAQQFGINFEPVPIRVDGRELEPVNLIAQSGREMRPSNGQYRPPPGERFMKPATINRWFLTFLVDGTERRQRSDDPDGMYLEEKFKRLYLAEGRSKGVNISDQMRKQLIPIEKDETLLRQNLKKHFMELNEMKVDHAIIFLPARCPDWVYGYLQYLEVCEYKTRTNERYTRTSCVKYQNYWSKIVNDRSDGKMFLSNLWLKYNTKLGGINFALSNSRNQHRFLRDGYIFISVDVCHPAPGDRLSQSVAAAVGMWDLTSANMSFCTRMRVQKKMRKDHSTIEEVGEIDKMIEDILASYKSKKNKLPTQVMILRDGVSEGQFRIVLERELKLVKILLARLYLKQKLPQLSCLVVQKRHKVCFMREQPVQTRDGPDYNIQPGTVVDNVITHPKDFSFYLAPHKALQGTSRPAHIYMICDEIKFSQDEAQAMVHALSYLSPRCTKSTSIPTPVNLADLAAERGKNIVVGWNEANRTMKLTDDQRLNKLNEFLCNCGDRDYKNTLFYI